MPIHCVTLYVAGELDSLESALAQLPPDVAKVPVTGTMHVRWEYDDAGSSNNLSWQMLRELPVLGPEVVGRLVATEMRSGRLALVLYSLGFGAKYLFWDYLDVLLDQLKDTLVLPTDIPLLDNLQPGLWRLPGDGFVLCFLHDIPVLEVRTNRDARTIREYIGNFNYDWIVADKLPHPVMSALASDFRAWRYRLDIDLEGNWSIERAGVGQQWRKVGTVTIMPDGRLIRFQSLGEDEWLSGQPFVVALLDYLARHDIVSAQIPVHADLRVKPLPEVPAHANKQRRESVRRLKIEGNSLKEIADKLETSIETINNDLRWLRDNNLMG